MSILSTYINVHQLLIFYQFIAYDLICVINTRCERLENVGVIEWDKRMKVRVPARSEVQKCTVMGHLHSPAWCLIIHIPHYSSSSVIE